MKYLNFAKHLPLVLGVMILFAACKKSENFAPLADGGQKYIKIVNYGGSSGSGFAGANLAFGSASTYAEVELQLELTTNLVSTTDITISLVADPALVAAYNATKTDPKEQYLVLPVGQYTFAPTTVTIKAGQTMSNMFKIAFNPSLINVAKNYMIPVAIKTITGAPADVKAAPNTSVAYFHFIGNALAGSYSNVALRYNYVGAVAFDGNPANIPPPASTTAIPATKFFSAIDPDYVWADFSNLGSQTSFNFQYLIKQLNSFANIQVAYNGAFTSGNGTIRTYLSNYVAPSPTQKARFRIITHYNNDAGNAGNDRIIDEYFTQQ